jgi:hypothetical protein
MKNQYYIIQVIIFLWCYQIYALQRDVLYIRKSDPVVTTSKMPLLVAVIDHVASQDLRDVASFVRNNLEHSCQFAITLRMVGDVSTKKDIFPFFQEGYSLVVFLSESEDAASFEWRLYDASQGEMIKGKKCTKFGNDPTDWALCLTRSLWHELMNTSGPFTSKLAYIQKVPCIDGSFMSKIWICDYNGDRKRMIFSNSRISIAPYWGKTEGDPFIIFSEFMPSNVRLVAVDLQGHKRVVFDRDGTCVGVAYNGSDADIIYGKSGGIWQYNFDPVSKMGTHVRIISEQEPCACPCWDEYGNIIYCCQGKIKIFQKDSKKSRFLTQDSYCVGPDYNIASKMLVYCKKIQGIMQLFTYNSITKKHRQLTFDGGDKTDPRWSMCGTMIAYCWHQPGVRRIATISLATGERMIITPVEQDCCYPAWSISDYL